MFIPHLHQYCLFLALFACTTSVFADIYKWVDNQGETHYSQLPPKDQQVELIKAPPPPAFDPSQSQKEIDELIAQQSADKKAQLEQQQKTQQDVQQRAIRQQNCETAKQNLQQYKHNLLERRPVDKNGNVVQLKEEERQQQIIQHQEKIKEFCS